jgi:hypothetical protein
LARPLEILLSGAQKKVTPRTGTGKMPPNSHACTAHQDLIIVYRILPSPDLLIMSKSIRIVDLQVMTLNP